MAGVDTNIYRFDYDLTFAALLMNADGTVYHRYGTRAAEGASSRLSMKAFSQLLRDSLEDHRAYMEDPSPPPRKPILTIEQIPSMAQRLKKDRIDCFHCHFVYDYIRKDQQALGTWSRSEIWKYPLPDQIGLLMDVDDPSLIQKVISSSAAYRSGMRSKDRLIFLEDQRVRTHADIQWVLENADATSTTLRAVVERKGKTRDLKLRLRKGWKVSDSKVVSWRPTMWSYRPSPGFGGPMLKPDELAKWKLPEDRWTMRVTYIVNWGENKADGLNAMQAGLKRGDIILSVAGKSDFISSQHFQSWFRFKMKPGSKVEFRILRNGKSKRIKMKVLP